MILIKNCDLMSMGTIPRGMADILVHDGKIERVENTILTPEGCKEIDAGGRIVTPGLVESHCHIGTSSLDSQNTNEKTHPTLGGLRALDALDFNAPEFTRALKTGVTTLITGPGSSNLIGGVFMGIKSAGDSVESRIISEELTLKMALGENPRLNYGKIGKSPSTRMGAAALIREALFKAREYREKWLAHQAGDKKSGFSYDIHLHSLMRAFDGMIVKIHAHQADDIMTAIRIAKEFGIRISIEHCTEGYLITKELKEAGYPVIIGPIAGGKGKLEISKKTYEAGAILEREGIPFAIATDSGVIPMEGLLMQAALLVKRGLSKETALEALTINAARFTDVSDRVGSIEPKKDADIVIWNMHPLDTMSRPDMVMIDGKIRLMNGEVCTC
ncbi:MAG: amidohydrolase [Clostridiaceae bacterium]|nr:amidohydrolase [Clostridiaceae bacterium]